MGRSPLVRLMQKRGWKTETKNHRPIKPTGLRRTQRSTDAPRRAHPQTSLRQISPFHLSPVASLPSGPSAPRPEEEIWPCLPPIPPQKNRQFKNSRNRIRPSKNLRPLRQRNLLRTVPLRNLSPPSPPLPHRRNQLPPPPTTHQNRPPTNLRNPTSQRQPLPLLQTQPHA